MKKCFKCSLLKPLSEFYKHRKMTDGHLGKCKDCTKKDVKERESNLRKTSPLFVENEKVRGREKYFRLGHKKQSPESKKVSMVKYKLNYPEKYLAKNMSQKVQVLKGNQRHHWSYNTGHEADIIELSVLEHKKLHRYMIYDPERYMYRRCDNMELLDTKQNHIEFYKSLINKP